METGDYKHIQAILVNTFSSWEELNTSFKVGTWLKGDASEGASGAVSGGGLSAALPAPGIVTYLIWGRTNQVCLGASSPAAPTHTPPVLIGPSGGLSGR